MPTGKQFRLESERQGSAGIQTGKHDRYYSPSKREVHLSMAVLAACALMLSGCGSSFSAITTSGAGKITLRGEVRSGQHPVVGATVQLYAVGNSGPGSASTPLLKQTVTTSRSGGFDVTGLYACPDASTPVYLVGRGGNPGLAEGTTNTALALMTYLGACGAMENEYVTVNEVTTIGSVWPLASYMASSTKFGVTGVDNAFINATLGVSQLIDPARGVTPGLIVPANAIVQTAKLNTLANALAACGNSSGGTAGDASACGILFSLATPSGETAPENTVDAALRIARNTSINPLSLYNPAIQTAAFGPALESAPVDWKLNLLTVPRPPSIEPLTGTYPVGQAVVLTTAAIDAVIRYTLDGSTPSTNSSVYTSPLVLDRGVTVRAMAVQDGVSSSVSSATYAVTLPHLVFNSPPVGAVTGNLLNPAPSVSVVNSSGTVVSTATNAVTLRLVVTKGRAAGLQGTEVMNARHGVATFTDLSVSAPGSEYMLEASSPGITSAASASFTVARPTVELLLPSASINLGETLNGKILVKAASNKPVITTVAATLTGTIKVSPTRVTIPAGATTGTFTYTGTKIGGALLSASAKGYSSSSVALAVVSPEIPTTLRAAASLRGILVGAAVDADEFGYTDPLTAEPLYASTLATQYNMVEAESAMKWIVLHPTQGSYNFEPGDQIASFAQAHQMKVRGHNLCWDVANPEWLITLGETNPAALPQVLHDHISTVMGHYKGKVFAWDVVNEAISDDATGIGTQMKDSIWYNTPGLGMKGTGYVEQAFRWARQADPNALLFYNEYLVYGPSPKLSALYNMLADFVARGVPIDGVGLQLHVGTNGWPNSEGLTQVIAQIASLGLQVHITEMDVQIPVDSAGVGRPVDLDAQAQTYARILNVCLANKNCTAFQTWGFTDRHSWIPSNTPGQGAALPFDSNYVPKPAFSSLLGALNARTPGTKAPMSP